MEEFPCWICFYRFPLIFPFVMFYVSSNYVVLLNVWLIGCLANSIVLEERGFMFPDKGSHDHPSQCILKLPCISKRCVGQAFLNYFKIQNCPFNQHALIPIPKFLSIKKECLNWEYNHAWMNTLTMSVDLDSLPNQEPSLGRIHKPLGNSSPFSQSWVDVIASNCTDTEHPVTCSRASPSSYCVCFFLMSEDFAVCMWYIYSLISGRWNGKDRGLWLEEEFPSKHSFILIIFLWININLVSLVNTMLNSKPDYS